MTELDDSGDVVGSHSYSVAGFHSVVLTVLDDDGDVGASAAVTIIVFDPVSLWIDGEAEFELRVSNEDFEALQFDWYVEIGTTAYLTGEGSLGDREHVRFLFVRTGHADSDSDREPEGNARVWSILRGPSCGTRATAR